MSTVLTTAKRLGRLSILAACLVFVAACGRPPPREVTPSEINMRKLGSLYLAYAGAQKDGLGPASVDDLKKFVTGLDEKRLTTLNLTKADVDTVFVSPRDNQPYGIVPKVGGFGSDAGHAGDLGIKGAAKKQTTGAGPPRVIVYEKASGGIRLVLYNNLDVRDVDDATFQQLVPNPK